MLADWFSPGYKAGGPIQSCVNIAYALKETYDVFVLTSDTDLGDSEPYAGVPSNKWLNDAFPGFAVYYFEKKTRTVSKLKQVIVELNPDFVYLNHLFSPWFVVLPLVFKYRNAINATVVLCPRGALYASALAVKSYKKFPFITAMRTLKIHKKIVFQASDVREQEAIEKYFPGSRIRIAEDMPKMDQQPLVGCEKIPGELRCIFIARIMSIKNLLFVLKAFFTVQSNIIFTVIGPEEDSAYAEDCRKMAASLPSNIRVEFKGPVPNKDLPEFLHVHHLYILPTTGESFGHSIFEALLNGRPVLISDQTPWVNLRQQKVGWDLALSNESAFTSALEEAASWTQQEFDLYASNAWKLAADFVKKNKLIQQYQELFS